MNVIITNSFLKRFKKEFRKNNFLISDLVNELKKEKLITLKIPLFKVKLKLNKISIRWIVLVNHKNYILPIFIVLKKDKKYWENLILNKELQNIIEKLSKEIEIDLINKDFIKY